MRLLVALVALLILPLLAACGQEPLAPPQTTATPNLITMQGQGPGAAPPFKMTQGRGQYKVYWKSSKDAGGPNDPAGCPMKANMESAMKDLGYSRNLIDAGSESTTRPGMMEGKPFNLEVGSYFVAVDTPCHWTLLLERQITQ